MMMNVGTLSVAFAVLSPLAFADCPVPEDARWGPNSKPYRSDPILDSAGNNVYIGWKPENVGCESCGYSSGSTGPPGSTDGPWESLYNYNYAWNVETGLRSFWENEERGLNHEPGFLEWCTYGYERNTWNPFKTPKCVMPSSDHVKFLGEECTEFDQCHNSFVDQFVDVTCSPTREGGPNKCMLDEESGGGLLLSQNICSCVGIFYCESDDCQGSQCVLSTYDGNKHCKYGDEDPFTVAPTNPAEEDESWGAYFRRFLFGTSCSNCRASDYPCIPYDGEAAETDSKAVGITAGVVGIGCAGLLGAGFWAKRRKITGPKEKSPVLETEMASKSADVV